jgi:hypothetical protein
LATHFTGRVTRLYPSTPATYVRLDIPENQQPSNSYFALRLSHENYNALYSTALIAAVNGYNLTIRTIGDINPGQDAFVRYMVLNW